MGTKSTHQQQSTHQIVILGVNYFTLIPKEVIYLIISMLDPLDCRQLSMTSYLLRKPFTYTVVCISNKTKLNFKLARLYNRHYSQFLLQPIFIPQFLIFKNSNQLVKYKKTMDPMHDDHLIIDFSENLLSLDISEFSSLLINFPNYESPEDAIKRSVERFEKFFQFKKYPNVKKLVLNNLVYSSRFINLLIGTFDGLKYLNIASYNNKSKFDVPLSNFTTINELEITLSTSDDFDNNLLFTPPIQLEKITFNSLRQNSKTISCCLYKVRTITILQCTLLKAIILKNNFNDDINNLLYIDIPPCLENFTSDTNGWKSIYCQPKSEYSHFRIIHVSESSSYKFIIRSPDEDEDEKLSLNFDMCPNCIEFGVFDKDGKLRIIWKK